MIWKNIAYNIGNSFDSATGLFTCPQDGIYSFYATSPIRGAADGNIFIYVNGAAKIHHYVYNYGGQSELNHNSPYGEFKLSEGDTVHIHMSGTFYYASTSCDRTYFQGHLIEPL